MNFAKDASEFTHYEFSSDKREVEIYIGSYFLASVDIDYISDEARDYLFESEE
jgi:hypothetical protein